MSLWLFLLLKSPPVNQTQMRQGSLECRIFEKRHVLKLPAWQESVHTYTLLSLCASALTEKWSKLIRTVWAGNDAMRRVCMLSLTHLINAITLTRGLSQLSEMEYRDTRSGNSEENDRQHDLGPRCPFKCFCSVKLCTEGKDLILSCSFQTYTEFWTCSGLYLKDPFM